MLCAYMLYVYMLYAYMLYAYMLYIAQYRFPGKVKLDQDRKFY